jgi:hypothetical protein
VSTSRAVESLDRWCFGASSSASKFSYKSPETGDTIITEEVRKFPIRKIPPRLIAKLARETGVASMARTFSPWSHGVCMLFAQLTHAIGLNDVCDALRIFSGPLSALRGASAPSRNNLSHANKHRDAALAERLFWSVLDHLQKLSRALPSDIGVKG